VLDKVKKGDQEKVKRDLHRISYAKNRKLATPAYWAFCQKYRKVYPEAVKSLESEINDLLSFYEVKLSSEERKGRDAQELEKAQEALWRRIRTTNIIERAFVEVKRRTRPMGSLVTEVVWNEFSMRSSFTTILKARKYPLSFLHRELDTTQLDQVLAKTPAYLI
jgi:transposase-like protein